jgi:hypothetical protein
MLPLDSFLTLDVFFLIFSISYTEILQSLLDPRFVLYTHFLLPLRAGHLKGKKETSFDTFFSLRRFVVSSSTNAFHPPSQRNPPNPPFE